MSIAAFVITMRSATQRKIQVNRLMEASPVPCRRWEATDGRTLTTDEIAEHYRPVLYQPRYRFGLVATEIGCFLSHRRIWQQIVDESLSHALIMEDDLELLPNFRTVFEFAIRHAPPASVIKFDVRDFRGRYATVAKADGMEIIRPMTVPLRATAQLVPRVAAERLLEHSRHFDRPVDTFLQMRWQHGVDILLTRPRCTAEVSMRIGGSIINGQKTRRNLIQSLVQECRRAIYRHDVSSRSRRDAVA
jgi:glycosyl transferase, family 25